MLVQPQKGRKELAVVPLSTPSAGDESRSENKEVPRAALSFDPNEYIQFLAETDWTESQKTEFTQELWTIILNFIDLGFRVDSVEADGDKTPEMLGLESNFQIDKTCEADLLGSAERLDS